MRFHRPKVVSCEIFTVIQCTPLIRYYLPPDNMGRLPGLKESLFWIPGESHRRHGDLIKYVGQMVNPKNKQVSDFLESFIMLDILGHFRKHLRFRIKQMWWKVHQSKILCSQCNYILGLNLRLLKTFGIRDLSSFSSNHFSLCTLLL